MVKRFLALFRREVSGLHEAAFLLGFSAFISQLLALVRDRLLAVEFGAGSELDIYYSAFRLPDLLYVSIASFISVAVVIPLLTERQHDVADSRRLLDSLLSVFLLVMVVVSALAWWLLPALAPLVAPGFDPAATGELVALARIILLSPLLLGLSNLLGAVTQSRRRFFIYATSPILYNLGIIAGVVWLYPALGLPGLAWGVALGALAHVSIQLPVVAGAGLLPWPTLRPDWREAGRVVLVSIPRTIALASQQLALWVLVSIATLVGAGSVAVLTFAQNLQSVPISIIGVSYSVAAFPTLTALFTNGERSKFITQMTTALRHIIFWSLPVMVLFIVLRAQIVRVILGAGRFDWTDTRLVAAALALFMLSGVAQSLVLLFVRAYYAARRTWVPLVINVASAVLVVTAGFALWQLASILPDFARPLATLLRVDDLEGTAVLALPFAFTLGMIFNVVLYWIFFQRDFGRFPQVVDKGVWQSAGGSLAAGVASYFALQILDDYVDINTFWGIFTQGLGAGLAGVIVFTLLLYTLGNKELGELAQTLQHKFWRSAPIAPEPSGLENP